MSSDSEILKMENALGLLRIHVKRGVKLAVRDVRSSDPYVLVRLGKQKVRTRFVKKNLNPEWNENLTLCVTDPNIPLKLYVYDRDRFSFDDKMGHAEIDIRPFIRAARMNLVGYSNGAIIEKVQPNRQNCLSEESCIICCNGKVVQDIVLRLRDVECGEVELQLQWIELPAGSKRF